MKQINTKRINGYLDLNSYFGSILGHNKDVYNIDSLHEQGLIEYEIGGLSDKFWLLDPISSEKIALFKLQNGDNYEAYAELFAEEIAKVLGMKTAHYDLAMFNNKKGVISYNFIKDEDFYYSGFDVIADFYERTLESDPKLCELYNIDFEKDTIDDVVEKLNNLEDIWIILEDKYKNHYFKQQIVEKIVDKLVDKLIFDTLTVNSDDHCDNWGLIDDNLAPSFDNSRILKIHMSDLNEDMTEYVENTELLLTVDNSNTKKPLEVLEQFLKVSSSEYRDRVIDKVNKLEENIEYIPGKISRRTQYEMPQQLRSYFIHHMYGHLDKVNAIIYDTKSTKK